MMIYVISIDIKSATEVRRFLQGGGGASHITGQYATVRRAHLLNELREYDNSCNLRPRKASFSNSLEDVCFSLAFVCDALLEPPSVDGLLVVPNTICRLLHEKHRKYTEPWKALQHLTITSHHPLPVRNRDTCAVLTAVCSQTISWKATSLSTLSNLPSKHQFRYPPSPSLIKDPFRKTNTS